MNNKVHHVVQLKKKTNLKTSHKYFIGRLISILSIRMHLQFPDSPFLLLKHYSQTLFISTYTYYVYIYIQHATFRGYENEYPLRGYGGAHVLERPDFPASNVPMGVNFTMQQLYNMVEYCCHSKTVMVHGMVGVTGYWTHVRCVLGGGVMAERREGACTKSPVATTYCFYAALPQRLRGFRNAINFAP